MKQGEAGELRESFAILNKLCHRALGAMFHPIEARPNVPLSRTVI
jgi:hypothetical protein